jgi:hypothetical protein
MRLLLVPTLSAALLVCACGGGGGSTTPANTQAQGAAEASSIDARLRAGPWRLVDYRPDVPLEATLQQLLQIQMQTMVIRFDNGHIYADSPTLHIDRPYQVTDAGGPIFKLVSPDIGGGTVTSGCQISDDGREIQFHGESEPWIGRGLLRRQ